MPIAQIIDQRVGKRVAYYRKEIKMTQQELANCIQMSVQQVQKYEYGETSMSVEMLYKISQALNVSMGNFLSEVTDEQTALITGPEVEHYHRFNRMSERQKALFRELIVELTNERDKHG